ncbi:hypothetical protein QTP86_011967 [Hemibagrus guttatus]|nr:hypothetical protein QTP86_011967 [Hemibagrus guttatus]
MEIYLEKAYDRVPREELWYCMRKSGVAEKYVRVVQDMYERSRTVVRCAVGLTEEFNVEVGLHQGSALSPFLFAIVMDQLSEEVRQESPWTMMFADDIVICSESREQVEENLERWRFALERRGMKVSRSKTEYMCVNEREGSGTVRLQGEEVKKVQEFKYLGSTVQSNGECGKEVKKRVQAGWNGWRKVSGVLCDQKISARIKGKVYRTVVRPAMLYGLETVSLRKRQESELEVAELKMLRFSLGVTRLDRIRNEYIRGTAHVGRLGDKVREARLRWFGHVQRRDNLEKAYDRVPREELWYCMRKSGVAEKYARVVQDMYERSRTVVRCAVVMDQLSEEVRQESPWTMMFADDIVICSESREQVEENLERWRFVLERRGMKVSRSKTEYMCVNEREGSGTVRLQGEEVKKVQEFKYLGSTVQSNGECGKEVKKRVQAGWNGWRKVSGVLCDQKISARIKGKVYRTVVRSAMLYGLETVSLRKRQESELEVAELKMLRFSLGVTRLDRIRNEYIRGTAHVGRLGDKVREARLRWFGHVQRRESEYIGRRMLDMELPALQGIGFIFILILDEARIFTVFAS